jgi:hypothetical protein
MGVDCSASASLLWAGHSRVAALSPVLNPKFRAQFPCAVHRGCGKPQDAQQPWVTDSTTGKACNAASTLIGSPQCSTSVAGLGRSRNVGAAGRHKLFSCMHARSYHGMHTSPSWLRVLQCVLQRKGSTLGYWATLLIPAVMMGFCGSLSTVSTFVTEVGATWLGLVARLSCWSGRAFRALPQFLQCQGALGAA